MKRLFRLFCRSLLTVGILIFLASAILPIVKPKGRFLMTEEREIHSLKSIDPLKSAFVAPILYKGSIQLDHLPVELKKQKFLEIMVPAVLVAKHRLEQQRKHFQALNFLELCGFPMLEAEHKLLTETLKTYRANNLPELLDKMQLPPTSVILAQAAVESGWGTSRFFREGNNIFGIWSYNSREARLQALQSRSGTAIYVRRYQNLSASVEDYLALLIRSNAYSDLRERCRKEKDPYQVLPGLLYYSELREKYIHKLEVVMRSNQLTDYDEYAILPSAFF